MVGTLFQLHDLSTTEAWSTTPTHLNNLQMTVIADANVALSSLIINYHT